MSAWTADLATSLGVEQSAAALVDLGTGNGSLLAALSRDGYGDGLQDARGHGMCWILH